MGQRLTTERRWDNRGFSNRLDFIAQAKISFGRNETKKADGIAPASRLNDQVGYLFFSVAMRKATRPSSGTVSSWMLKPLPSACAHALPMRDDLRSFHEIIQRPFQLLKCFLQAQHQRGHFLPVQVKGIGVAEHMTETQVFVQRVVKFFRQQRRAVRRRRFHPQQKFTMPGIATHRLAVQLNRHALKNVFDAGVK
jgi:hypothetical protein